MESIKYYDDKITDLYLKYNSVIDYESSIFVPSLNNIFSIINETKLLQKRMNNDYSSKNIGPDDTLIEVFNETLNILQAKIRNDVFFPNRYISRISSKLNKLYSFDERNEDERFDIIIETLESTPEIIEAVENLSFGLNNDKIKYIKDEYDGLYKLLENINDSIDDSFDLDHNQNKKIKLIVKDVNKKIERSKSDLGDFTNKKCEHDIKELSYSEILSEIYGIDINDLLDSYIDDVKKCENDFKDYADSIQKRANPFSILKDETRFCKTPEDMFDLLEKYIAIAKKNTKKYIDLPAKEECIVKEIPEFLKDSYPWGGYYARSHPLRKDLRGSVFLNQYNYKNISIEWIKLNAIHEAYPGHHVDHVITAANDMPKVFKVHSLESKASPLSEGIAHRSEKIFKDIFNDKLFPLFVLYRRLHTAVRVWTDLLIHHFKESDKKAIEVYQNNLNLSYEEAKGQILAQKLMPGYFTVYHYGLKNLEVLQNKFKWSDEDFTELIFTSGKVSLSTLEKLMEMKEKERNDILKRFSENFK